MYVDGYQRSGVVCERKKFVQLIKDLQAHAVSHVFSERAKNGVRIQFAATSDNLNSDRADASPPRPVVFINQDEAIIRCRDKQAHAWSQEHKKTGMKRRCCTAPWMRQSRPLQ